MNHQPLIISGSDVFKGRPKKFFRAADKYEVCGNRRFVEIEFALPNELTTVEQYLIDDVEKIKERSPKNFFKYLARKKKDGSLPTFDDLYYYG